MASHKTCQKPWLGVSPGPFKTNQPLNCISGAASILAHVNPLVGHAQRPGRRLRHQGLAGAGRPCQQIDCQRLSLPVFEVARLFIRVQKRFDRVVLSEHGAFQRVLQLSRTFRHFLSGILSQIRGDNLSALIRRNASESFNMEQNADGKLILFLQREWLAGAFPFLNIVRYAMTRKQYLRDPGECESFRHFLTVQVLFFQVLFLNCLHERPAGAAHSLPLDFRDIRPEQFVQSLDIDLHVTARLLIQVILRDCQRTQHPCVSLPAAAHFRQQFRPWHQQNLRAGIQQVRRRDSLRA